MDVDTPTSEAVGELESFKKPNSQETMESTSPGTDEPDAADKIDGIEIINLVDAVLDAEDEPPEESLQQEASTKDIFALWQKRDSEQENRPDITRHAVSTSTSISDTLTEDKLLQNLLDAEEEPPEESLQQEDFSKVYEEADTLTENVEEEPPEESLQQEDFSKVYEEADTLTEDKLLQNLLDSEEEPPEESLQQEDFSKVYAEADTLSEDRAPKNRRVSAMTEEKSNAEEEKNSATKPDFTDSKRKKIKKKKRTKKNKTKDVNEFKKRKQSKEERKIALQNFLGEMNDTLTVRKKDDDSVSFITVPPALRDGEEGKKKANKGGNQKQEKLHSPQQLRKKPSINLINPMIATKDDSDEDSYEKLLQTATLEQLPPRNPIHMEDKNLPSVGQPNESRWETMSDFTEERPSTLERHASENSGVITLGTSGGKEEGKFDVEQGLLRPKDSEQPSMPEKKKKEGVAISQNQNQTKNRKGLAAAILCITFIVIGVIFISN
jgi:hypothetical protein